MSSCIAVSRAVDVVLDCAQHSISILTYEVCVHPRVSILAFLSIKSLSNLERIKRISEFYHIIPLVNSRVHWVPWWFWESLQKNDGKQVPERACKSNGKERSAIVWTYKSNECPRKPGDHSRWNCSYCWCCGDGYQFSTESQSGNTCTANSRSQLCCWPQASKRICEVNFVSAFMV